MPASAALLALAAAFLHAGWNLAVAREEDSEAVAALAISFATLAFAPAALLTAGVERAAAPYIVASAVLHLVYFALLAAAYNRAELSVVYPLARGVAPVIVLVASVAALGADVSAVQGGGVLAVAAGVLLVRDVRRLGDPRDLLLSLAIAAGIAGYTLVDKEGVRHAAPIAYLELVSLGFGWVYLGAVARARGLAAMRAAARPRIALAGLAMFGAYVLVLAALELAPAAPVAAIRESSVVIATWFAAFFLDEEVRPRRAAGAAVVAGGVAALTLG